MHFPHLLSKFLLSLLWILFRQLAYYLFIYFDFCVSNLFLHLCNISLPFHYFFFNLLCFRSPFPRLQGWILSSFWFLPSWGLPSGLCKLCIEWDLCWVFFSPSDGQGWMRWYFCLLMVGFIFLFCLLFRWGILHRVLLAVGWCWVLCSSGFLCGRSHYLILPRISSLVV